MKAAKNLKSGDGIIKMAGMYFQRAFTDRFFILLRTFPAVAVTGARQVGKSTLLEHVLSDEAEFVVVREVLAALGA